MKNGKVSGTKSFKYFMVPKEPGQFALKDYFQWVYFDPAKKKYDTLRSKLVVQVEGESHQNQAIQSMDFGAFYNRIDTADNQLYSTDRNNWMQIGMNGLIALMLGTSLFLILRKPA